MYYAFTITSGRKPIKIYATDPYNLNYWLTAPLTPDPTAVGVDKVVNVKQHTRKQYPGQSNPPTQRQVQLVRYIDPNAHHSNALPGRTVKIRALNPAIAVEAGKRSLTVKGAFIDFLAFIEANRNMDVYLWNSSGRRYTLKTA